MQTPHRFGDARKIPRQERSRATVEAIIEAAAEVLAEARYEGATTTLVADRAGVSVGTLYQYFPNKRAYVAALAERYMDEMVGRIASVLEEIADDAPLAGLRKLADAAVDAYLVEPQFQKELIERLPDVGKLEEAFGARRRITEMLEAYLRTHAEQLGICDPGFVAFGVQTTFEALAQRTIVERPALLRDARWRALSWQLLEACLAADRTAGGAT